MRNGKVRGVEGEGGNERRGKRMGPTRVGFHMSEILKIGLP